MNTIIQPSINTDQQTSPLQSFPPLYNYLTTTHNYTQHRTRTVTQCIISSCIAGTAIGTIQSLVQRHLSMKPCITYSIQLSIITSAYMLTSISINKLFILRNPPCNIHSNTNTGIVNHMLSGSIVGGIVGGCVNGPRGSLYAAASLSILGTTSYILYNIKQYYFPSNNHYIMPSDTIKKPWIPPRWFPIQYKGRVDNNDK